MSRWACNAQVVGSMEASAPRAFSIFWFFAILLNYSPLTLFIFFPKQRFASPFNVSSKTFSALLWYHSWAHAFDVFQFFQGNSRISYERVEETYVTMSVWKTNEVFNIWPCLFCIDRENDRPQKVFIQVWLTSGSHKNRLNKVSAEIVCKIRISSR